MIRIIVLSLLSLSFYAKAQTQHNIYGYIYDKSSGEALASAHVKDTISGLGVSSNVHGYFSIKLASGSACIQVSYAGKHIYLLPMMVRSDTLLNIYAEPYLLEEVTIQAKPEQRTKFSNLRLNPAEFKGMPTMAGEPDLMKTITLFPGVSSGMEGTVGLYVRGGTPDQNLILLDGVHLYNPNHLFGFLSVFNSDALKDVNFYKGAFPAKYGGRLSSIIDITSREGNNQKLKGTIGIGLISSKLLLEGPIKKDKSSFFIAARSAYFDVLTLPVRILFKQYKVAQMINYSMYDINSKLSFNLEKNGKLSFSLYKGADIYSVSENRAGAQGMDLTNLYLKWGNTSGSINYQRLLGTSIFSKFNLYTTNYQYGLLTENKEGDKSRVFYDSKSAVSDLAFHSEFDWNINNFLSFNWGGQYILHRYRPVKSTASWSSEKVFSELWSQEGSVFAEGKFNVHDKWMLDAGLNLSAYYVGKKYFSALDPRFKLSYQISPKITLNTSYSGMHQFVHLLGTNAVGLSNDLWIPATDNLPGSQSRQVNLGVAYNQAGSEGHLELFYKKSDNLVEYNGSNNILLAVDSDWESLAMGGGIGKSYGAEFYYKKVFNTNDHSISYTYNPNFRKFTSANFNEWYPANYNKLHDFTYAGNWKMGGIWSFNWLWTYSSGVPYSAPEAIAENIEGYKKPIYLYKNNARMPDYHRLDLGFSRVRYKKNRTKTLSLGVYNAYNRKNPFYIDYHYVNNPRFEEFKKPIITKATAFPFMPYIYYSLSF